MKTEQKIDKLLENFNITDVLRSVKILGDDLFNNISYECLYEMISQLRDERFHSNLEVALNAFLHAEELNNAL